MDNSLHHLDIAIKEYRTLTNKTSNFGSLDTEPRWHFTYAIEKSLEGKKVIPQSAYEWELFSDMRGAEKVANKMTKLTEIIVNFILDSRISQREDVKRILAENFIALD